MNYSPNWRLRYYYYVRICVFNAAASRHYCDDDYYVCIMLTVVKKLNFDSIDRMRAEWFPYCWWKYNMAAAHKFDLALIITTGRGCWYSNRESVNSQRGVTCRTELRGTCVAFQRIAAWHLHQHPMAENIGMRPVRALINNKRCGQIILRTGVFRH